MIWHFIFGNVTKVKISSEIKPPLRSGSIFVSLDSGLIFVSFCSLLVSSAHNAAAASWNLSINSLDASDSLGLILKKDAVKYRVDGQSCCILAHTSMESCSIFIQCYSYFYPPH